MRDKSEKKVEVVKLYFYYLWFLVLMKMRLYVSCMYVCACFELKLYGDCMEKMMIDGIAIGI